MCDSVQWWRISLIANFSRLHVKSRPECNWQLSQEGVQMASQRRAHGDMVRRPAKALQ